MAYKAKAYTLREESTESGIRYFISFKDGQGEHHELEVSEQLFFEFRQMERRNRNLLQWDERHREFSEVWDETLNRRALKLPKSIEEQMIEAERAELLCKAVDRLPEIQRRRFLLYYEYEFNVACPLSDCESFRCFISYRTHQWLSLYRNLWNLPLLY
ncbi:TPA: sigma-70 family RNA polymerase sigma factor [Streptococcus suis]